MSNELLTDDEHKAIELAGELFNLLTRNRRHIHREQRLIYNRLLVRKALGLDEPETFVAIYEASPPSVWFEGPLTGGSWPYERA